MDAFNPKNLIRRIGLGSLVIISESLAIPPCECIGTDYYSSEALPLASLVTACPDWPASFPRLGARGLLLEDPLPAYQGQLFLSQKLIPYADGSVKTVAAIIKGQKQDCQQMIRSGDQALNGWNIVLLTHWYALALGSMTAVKRLDQNILSTIPGPILFPMEEVDAMQVKAFFQAQGKGVLPKLDRVQFASYPKQFDFLPGVRLEYVPTPSGGARGAVLGSVLTKNLLSDIRKTLQANGWTQFEPGLVVVAGKWVPAILKLFGNPGKVYAYYGRFTSAEEAKRFGYTTSDPLYFSARSLVPAEETEVFQPDLRYGARIFRPEEVITNRRLLEWHSECRCSDLHFEGDDRNVAVVDKKGNWTPIAPDNAENSNPALFKDCPDQRTYFSLYKICVEKDLKEERQSPDLRGRVDYGDYLASKLGESPVYKSMNPDGSIDHEDLSVDIMPETPAYYDKTGARLNPNHEDLMDPLDANTVFYAYRYGPKAWDDWEGSKEKQYRINPRIHALMGDMQSLFETVVSKGKEPLLELFQIRFNGGGGVTVPLSPGGRTSSIQAFAAFGKLDLDLAIGNPDDLNKPIRILNTSDKYLEYKSARTFITQSQTGMPLKVQKWADGKEWDDFILGSDLDDLKFRVYWDYGLFVYNSHGDPAQVGTLRISNIFWKNSEDGGQKLVGKWVDQIHMEGGKLLSTSDTYDLSSREAHTDLKSLHERDPATFEDKSEAMARIAYYIAVSEGLDMAMKWIFSQKDKPYIYESAKRLENMVAVKQSAKVAYAFYKGYVEWRRLMDILAEIRDSRRALERAYSRFKRSGGLLVDFFVNLDYAKIRPTNISMVYPTRAMRYFDWSTNEFRNELLHFETSLHALNLDLDRFMDGPGKRTLAYLYRETAGSLAQVETENDRDRAGTHQALKDAQAALGRGGDNTSNYIRLSALTRLAIQKTRNTQVKSLEASTSGLRNVLMAVQSDSRDWLTMKDYVTHNLAGSPDAFSKAYQDRSPEAIGRQFDVQPIFRNTWVEDQLKGEAKP